MRKVAIAILFILLLLVPPAISSEARVGVAKSQDELNRAFVKWKYAMASTHSRTQDLNLPPTWGCFFYCIPKENGALIKWAFSYGDPTPETAQKKAAYAFDGESGTCTLAPTMQVLRSDQL